MDEGLQRQKMLEVSRVFKTGKENLKVAIDHVLLDKNCKARNH